MPVCHVGFGRRTGRSAHRPHSSRRAQVPWSQRRRLPGFLLLGPALGRHVRGAGPCEQLNTHPLAPSLAASAPHVPAALVPLLRAQCSSQRTHQQRPPAALGAVGIAHLLGSKGRDRVYKTCLSSFFLQRQAWQEAGQARPEAGHSTRAQARRWSGCGGEGGVGVAVEASGDPLGVEGVPDVCVVPVNCEAYV